jgi:hypothetical protein
MIKESGLKIFPYGKLSALGYDKADVCRRFGRGGRQGCVRGKVNVAMHLSASVSSLELVTTLLVDHVKVKA